MRSDRADFGARCHQTLLHFQNVSIVETVGYEECNLPGLDGSLLKIRIRDHAKRRRLSELGPGPLGLKLSRIRVRRKAHIQRLLQLSRHRKSQTFSNSIRERLVYLRQQKQHPLTDWRRPDLAQLEAKRAHNMVLFDRCLAVVEECRLTEVIKETWATLAHLCSANPFRITGKAAHIHPRLKRTAEIGRASCREK